LKPLFEDSDLDADDYLTFEEYQSLIAKAKKALEEAKNDPIRDVFNGANLSKSGLLTFDEYKAYLKTSQPNSDEAKL